MISHFHIRSITTITIITIITITIITNIIIIIIIIPNGIGQTTSTEYIHVEHISNMFKPARNSWQHFTGETKPYSMKPSSMFYYQ